MKNIKIVILLVISSFLISCGSASVSVKNNDETKKRSEEAFKELDRAITDDDMSLEDAEVIHLPKEKSSPNKVVEKKRPIDNTDSEMVNGYPRWVLDPAIDGWQYTAIGMARKQSGGIPIQKRTAFINAQGELSRIVNIDIENEISTQTIADNQGNVTKDIKTYSRQRSEELLQSMEEINSWVSPDGDYYLLIGIKGQ